MIILTFYISLNKFSMTLTLSIIYHNILSYLYIHEHTNHDKTNNNSNHNIYVIAIILYN